MKLQLSLLLLLFLIVGCSDLKSWFGVEEQIQETANNESGDNYILPTIINNTNTTEENITTITVISENVFFPPRKNNLSIYILDVDGQSIIVLKEKESLLIDSGLETDAQTILKRLRSLGVVNVDVAIASNTNERSIGGLPYIIIQTSPAKIYENGIPSPSSSYVMFKNLFQNTTKVSSDRIFAFEDISARMIVAYDDGRGIAVSNDDNSIVTRITYEDTIFLLMSNCGFDCIERISGDIAEANAIIIDGSCDSTTLTLLQKVKPEIAVVNGEVCADTKLTFEYLDIPFYTTKEHGDMRMESDGESFNLKYLKTRI